MERILIIGCGGAGKSTLARQLGERTGLPVVHLDQLFWHPGWVESTKDEIDAKIMAISEIIYKFILTDIADFKKRNEYES